MRELVVDALWRFALHERVYELAKLGSFGKTSVGYRASHYLSAAADGAFHSRALK